MFSLKQALLFSSQNRARCVITEQEGIIVTPRILCYVVASETGTLSLYHVSYPDEAPGKGQPCMDTRPYKTLQKADLTELSTYLEEAGFQLDAGWEPVEDEVEHG